MRLISIIFLLSALWINAQTTPLTKAIRLEKFDDAKKHITPELVNKMDQGQYHPLTYAVYTGNNELIESLLKAGADPNIVEHNGKTALYVAANLANTQGLKLLHKHGAKRPPKTALSPAVAAVHSSSLDSLQTLLELYPDIDLNRGWKKADKYYRTRPVGAVSYAAYHSYNDIALYLLTKNIDVTPTDWEGNNALNWTSGNPRCSVELVRKLLARGLAPPLSTT